MKTLPTGRQNFREIIEEDLLYVDKTKNIYNLISSDKLYFLSRPRRFGKTLLMSTLHHWFRGHQELFQQLYMGQQTDYSWDTYPVLSFNFATYGHQVEHLEAALSRNIQQYATQFEVAIDGLSLSSKLETLVTNIARKNKPVVILIDEYDKPIVDFLTELKQAKENQKTLRDFFSPLKDLERKGHLRFLFITGVSKFSKVSLFSDLNNLTDLSISPLAKDLLGITNEELRHYFPAHIKHTAKTLNMPETELLEGIQLWYDGYTFDGKTHLYNPFSLLHFFRHQYFGNFWFASGTPTFLVETIREEGLQPQSLESQEVDHTFFEKFSLRDLDMTGLLFQTGYLTIKSIRRKRYAPLYTLGYPNIEVRQSFYHNLIQAFTYQKVTAVSKAMIQMEEGLEQGKVEVFIDQLKILLGGISYHLLPKTRKNKQQTAFQVWEGYFQTIIYLVTAFMGLAVQTEITKHKGRLDLLAETEDFLYLMEFKLDQPAEDAIQQIKNREYLLSYQNSPKTIYLVGIGCSKAERNVENWEAEVWER